MEESEISLVAFPSPTAALDRSIYSPPSTRFAHNRSARGGREMRKRKEDRYFVLFAIASAFLPIRGFHGVSLVLLFIEVVWIFHFKASAERERV